MSQPQEMNQTRETIPFWLAVVITALLPYPLSVFLGEFNLPLWVSFIVWAQYFLYGSTPKAFGKILFPFAAGALFATSGMVLGALLGSLMNTHVGFNLGFAIAIAAMVNTMRVVPLFRDASLAYFNGMATMLAVLFTGSFPFSSQLGPVVAPIVAGAWTIPVGWLGAVFGWFNVTITFPRRIES